LSFRKATVFLEFACRRADRRLPVHVNAITYNGQTALGQRGIDVTWSQSRGNE